MKNKQSLTIELPWPPTTNTFLRHFVIETKGRAMARTCISKKGREFYAEVSSLIAYGNYPKLEGDLSVLIELYPPTKRKIDVDNRNKPVLDSIKCRPKDKNQILDSWIFADDDSQVKDLRTVMCDIVKGGKAIVTIKRFDPTEFYNDCPGPDGAVEEIPDFAYEQGTLFE